MSETLHSTTQAHEQGQDPGTPPDENPQDLRSRPNDAHNQHKTAETGLDSVDYPPQLHAGKVGLGPHYGEQNRATFGQQIAGLTEQLKGKITHDQHKVEEGHDRMTGELKRKQHERENQFVKPGGAAPSTRGAVNQDEVEKDSKKPGQHGPGSGGEPVAAGTK